MGNSPKIPQWLEKTERAAVIASWLGLGAAVISKELLALGLPLTLTASLNWANRKRWQQQYQQKQRAEIAQIHDTLATFPEPLDFNSTVQQLAKLEQSNQALAGQVEALKQQVRVKFKPERLERLESSLTRLREDLNDLQSQAVQKQDLELRLSQELHQLCDRLDRLPETSQEAQQVEGAIARIQSQLKALEQQTTRMEMAKWQSLDDRVASIQGQVARIDSGLMSVRRKQRATIQKLWPRAIEMIRENRAASKTVPLQHNATHHPLSVRPPTDRLGEQTLRQPQRDR